MKKAILAVIAAGLTASAAMGSNINISVQQPNGTNTITVAPGATVNYKIIGTLSDDVNDGLALIGLTLDFDLASPGGDLAPANTPTGPITCGNPMHAFVIPDGITNPGGFGGTVIGGNLIQIGGAQNTIKNTIGNAAFPIGAVLTGVAQPGGCGPATIATGSLTIPLGTALGTYHLNASDVFANVIVDGQTGSEVFWATEPAVFNPATNLTNLTVIVALPCDVARWDSVITHTRNGIDLVIPLNIPNDGLFSEPRSAIKKVVVTFNGTINSATATAANVIRCGNSGPGPGATPVDLSGVVVTTAVVASNTQMEINFTPPLPDFARYKIALSGVECSGGGAAQAGTGGLSRILTAVQGDANADRRVTASDLSLVRGLVFPLSPDPIDPAVLNQVRSDTNADKRVTVSDLSAVRGKVGNDARTTPDPVCP